MPHGRRFRFGVEMIGSFDGMSSTDSARRARIVGGLDCSYDDFHEGLGPITAMTAAL